MFAIPTTRKPAFYFTSGLGFIDPAFHLYKPTIPSLTRTAGGEPSQCNGETNTPDYSVYIINHCYSQGEVNWLAGLEYTPAPNHLLYFKASTAYRSGGFDKRDGRDRQWRRHSGLPARENNSLRNRLQEYVPRQQAAGQCGFVSL